MGLKGRKLGLIYFCYYLTTKKIRQNLSFSNTTISLENNLFEQMYSIHRGFYLITEKKKDFAHCLGCWTSFCLKIINNTWYCKNKIKISRKLRSDN